MMFKARQIFFISHWFWSAGRQLLNVLHLSENNASCFSFKPLPTVLWPKCMSLSYLLQRVRTLLKCKYLRSLFQCQIATYPFFITRKVSHKLPSWKPLKKVLPFSVCQSRVAVSWGKVKDKNTDKNTKKMQNQNQTKNWKQISFGGRTKKNRVS